METLHYIIQLPLIERLGWTLLHFLWQGAGVGLLAAMGLRIVRKGSPGVAYSICIGAMALCVICPVVTFLNLEIPERLSEVGEAAGTPVVLSVAAIPSPAEGSPRFPAEAIFVPEAPAPLPGVELETGSGLLIPNVDGAMLVRIRWALPWLVLIWFGIASTMSLRLLCAWLEVSGYVRRASPVTKPEWIRRMGELCACLGVRAKVRLMESVEVTVPAVVGAVRPVVLVPFGFLAGMAPAMAEAVILHELAHVRRHDYLVNLLQALLRSLLFYHPVVWWLDRKATLCREFCCDNIAANAVADKAVYARALEALAAGQHGGVKLAPAANDSSLVQRLRLLLGVGCLRVPSFNHMAGAGVFLCLALALIGSLYLSPMLHADEVVKPLNAIDGIEGQVFDTNGRPVAGAEVALYHLKFYYGLENSVVERSKTDAAGRFRLETEMEFFRHGRDNVRDVYTVVAWVENQALAWKVLASHLENPERLNLQLNTTRSRTVRVVDERGNAIAGADIFVHRLGGGENSSLFANGFGPLRAVTDAAGEAYFTSLPEKSLNFAAVKAGYANSWTGCGAVDNDAEIQLSPAGVVEGQVVDETGTPIPGILVCATPEWPLVDYDYARTDEAGRFRLDHLYGEGGCWTDDGGSGKYRIGLDSTDFQAQAKLIQLAPGEVRTGMRIEAKKAVRVSGVVRDPTTDLPVAFAVLSVQTPGGNREMESDAAGRFEFYSPSGEVRVGFWAPPPATYVITGIIDRERPDWIDQQVGREPVELTLYAPSAVSKPVSVTGRVVWPDGRPAEGVVLTPRLNRTRAQIVTERRRSSALEKVITGADGRFVLKDYPQGEVIDCLLRHADQGMEALVELPSVNADGVDVGDLSLGKTIRRQVEVVDLAGRPIENTKIDYGPFSGADLTRSQRVPTVDRERRYRVSTDAAGRVELRGCLPGYPYDLWIADQEKTWKRISAEELQSEAPLRIVLDAELQFMVEDTAGQRIEITEAAHRGFSESDRADKWNAIPILNQGEAASFIVSKETFQFSGPGSKVAMWFKTKDGAIGHAKGHFPVRGSRIRLVADQVVYPRAALTPPADIVISADDVAFRVTSSDGEPLAGVKIISDPLSGGRDRPRVEGETDSRGWCVFKDVVARIIYCEFTQDGYATQWHANVKKGSAIPVVLSNSTRLKGQISGQDGGLPGTVSLRLEANREKQWPDDRIAMVDGIPLIIETDAAGRYDFLIEPGLYRLHAESENGDFLSLEQLEVKAGQVNTLPARLESGVSTELHLIDSITGEPVPGVPVIVKEAIAPYTIGTRENSRRVSDAKGVVRWENLRPGIVRFDSSAMAPYSRKGQITYSRWWSAAHAFDFGREAARRFETETPRGNDGVGDLAFELTSDDNRFDVTMERGILISGVVDLPEVLPAGWVFVTLVPERGERTSLTGDSRDDISVNKENGTFSGWMPAGNGLKYRACAFLRNNSNQAPEYLPAAVSKAFHSKPGDAFVFNLSMLRGGSIYGRVLGLNGEPKPGVGVQAIPLDHHTGVDAEPTAVTDAAGRYRIGPIRAAEYEVRIDETPGVNIDKKPKDEKYVTVPMDGSVQVEDLIYR